MGKQTNLDKQDIQMDETEQQQLNQENQQPLETLKKEKEKVNTKFEKIDFAFTSDNLANEEEMAPVRDILSTGEEVDQELGFESVSFLTVEEVARFLEASYQIQGVFTYPELWKQDKSFFYEIAEGILPNINSWAERIPAFGHAIKTVSAAGSWGRLIWDMAFRWLRVSKQRELENKAKQEEEEKGGNVNGTNRPSGIVIP